MKLSSDASMLRITYENLTNFRYFVEFDRDSIQSLSKTCNKNIDRIFSDVPNGIAAKNLRPRDKHQQTFNPPTFCCYECCEILHSDWNKARHLEYAICYCAWRVQDGLQCVCTAEETTPPPEVPLDGDNTKRRK